MGRELNGYMMQDKHTGLVQAHVSDPAKCLGTKVSTTIYKKKPVAGDAAAIAAGTTVDITNWLSMALYPVSDGQLKYNGVATAIEPIYSGQPNVVIIHPDVTVIVVSVDCIVCGM